MNALQIFLIIGFTNVQNTQPLWLSNNKGRSILNYPSLVLENKIQQFKTMFYYAISEK